VNAIEVNRLAQPHGVPERKQREGRPKALSPWDAGADFCVAIGEKKLRKVVSNRNAQDRVLANKWDALESLPRFR
jgi:hypothetical protein